MALDVKIIKKRDYVYLAELNGSLDTETYQQLEEELKELIDSKTKVVVLDMKGVKYISSAGVKVIIWAKKTLEGKGANFVMINLRPEIEKVFEMMKILPMLDIFDDMPEADKYIDQIIKDKLKKQRIK